MRFSSLACCLVSASTVAVDAFVPAAVVQKAKTSASASLSMAKKSADSNDDSMPMWGKAAMASVVSWSMAAQLASAVMLPASSTSFQGTLRSATFIVFIRRFKDSVLWPCHVW
jgi:hypothetical protein